MTEYYINGDKVSQEVFERDANDNFNLSIDYTIREEDNKVIMEYSEV